MGNRRNKTVECEPLKVAPRCVKHIYATHAQACRARHGLIQFNKRNRSRRGTLEIYFCTSCEGWHIGHRPNPRKN